MKIRCSEGKDSIPINETDLTISHSMITASTPTRHHLSSDSPDVLSTIVTNGVNLAVWQREADPLCQRAIDALLSSSQNVSLDLQTAEKSKLTSHLIKVVKRGDDLESAYALAEDIWLLVELFCQTADTHHCRLRLERIDHDGCQLFHADNLIMRMLCTYAGPGTEWAGIDNVRYDELGSRGRSVEETNQAIIVDDSKIRHLKKWDVAMFSGLLQLNTPPLIHRSSRVPSKQEHRIRLCIDLPGACGC